MGRSKLPENEKRSKPLRIRLTPEERAVIDNAAAIDKTNSSDWAREVLLKAAVLSSIGVEKQ